eukprot:CAMPEP_0114547908 /NCGR_PEP_ID=MMETSP0114-20121206/4704_1 /TAXON_ID=31324 /ORGANISM="Goniomonas sp, Strain m" /LENGTH=430 /DNA_ID=CAMNT_0001732473 /DNA_START=60 /DNA_END=1352 /DNA_ORIENTATION=+
MRPPPRRCKESNVIRKLMNREICRSGARAFMQTGAQEKFKNFGLQGELDTHDPDASKLSLHFLLKRSKIVEIVAAKDIIFALASSGVCVAFARDKSNQRLCFLNTSSEEVIRSLFYNKSNNSIITVSVYNHDNFSSLNCRSTPLEYIRKRDPAAGFPLFESESLRWPGFVEFDDVNGKVLTYSATDRIYKVWDLKNYTHLYSISDKSIHEIKISPGIMLLIYQKASNGGHVPLKILSIENGDVLQSFKHQLHRSKKIDFIEQFNEKLLVKQDTESLQIVDVRDGDRTEVMCTQFMTPSAFIFLYENQLFLTFRQRNVSVWNFRGEKVTSFEDHTLWHPDCNTNNIYITSHQDLIISYCKSRDNKARDSRDLGSINVSNILNGKCIAKIRCNDSSRPTQMALEDVTALFYNEERNEIYTGNKDGRVHIWSN